MPDVRTRVYNYVNGKRGQQDGDGQCWTLAENGCRAAGAKTSNDLTPPGGDFADADYVWGTAIGLSEIQAGCILQFRDYECRVTQPDGAWERSEQPHHTSIAIGTPDGHGIVRVLHQNVPDGDDERKLVVENEIATRNATKPGSGGEVTYAVSGTIWAYRPIEA